MRIRKGEIKKKERKVKRGRDWPNGDDVKQIASEVFVSFGSSQKNGETKSKGKKKCIYKSLTIKESKK